MVLVSDSDLNQGKRFRVIGLVIQISDHYMEIKLPFSRKLSLLVLEKYVSRWTEGHRFDVSEVSDAV